jgi:hypothetical protein
VDDVALMPVVDAAPNVETMGMSMAGKPTGDKENPMIVMGKSMVSGEDLPKKTTITNTLNVFFLAS